MWISQYRRLAVHRLVLAIKRQVISILRHDHTGDGCLILHAAFDQARFCGRLGNASLERATCILGAAGYKDTELRGHYIQLFADDVTLGTTAAGHIFWRNYLFDARQMFGQDTATNSRLLRRCLWRINDLTLSMDYGHRRLNVFQCEVILIWIGLLGLGTIERPFEVGEQFFS